MNTLTSITRAPARPVCALALALAALLAGSGCGAFETPRTRPCGWLDRSQDAPGDVRPRSRTAVLVDVSPSTRPVEGTAPGTPVPDWAATVLSDPRAAMPELEGTDLSVAAFDGTRATVTWDVDQVSVPPVKGNDTLKADKRNARRACLEDRLRKLSAKAPGAERSDLLGALAAAGEQLGPEGERGIVVATDGLTNTGCADLRSAGFDNKDEIEDVVRRCRAAGELPDLTGIDVSLIGLGRSAGGAAPSSPQTTWLTSLWERLCRASGASCEVAATARTRPAARQGGSAGVTEPSVTFPEVSERPAGRTVTLTLPGSVLFATDRADLSPTARRTLDRAARRIRALDPSSVAVLGHTDSRGSEDRGRLLSLARAQAVRRALADRGIAVTSARGYSDERPKCRPEHRDGRPQYAAMACNRRVEIHVALRRP
ncbi:OmpA family protein [Streptomyces sp. NPDC049906]|uniref:OmpA family protein n=1 Tax=Streptomyces sp. NPDC049906 TaxID=3155656 RepID=UPI0034167454